MAEVVGVEEGRVEILPRKLVEDMDKDFTGEVPLPNTPHTHIQACAQVSSNHTTWWPALRFALQTLKLDEPVNNLRASVQNTSRHTVARRCGLC